MVTVKAARKALGLNQADVAKILGISAPTYNKYENNPLKMPIEMGLKFANLVGLPFDELIFLPNSPTESGEIK